MPSLAGCHQIVKPTTLKALPLPFTEKKFFILFFYTAPPPDLPPIVVVLLFTLLRLNASLILFHNEVSLAATGSKVIPRGQMYNAKSVANLRIRPSKKIATKAYSMYPEQ
jgi:hypothetical protein